MPQQIKWNIFQKKATIRMSKKFNCNLSEKKCKNHPKKFDMVSADKNIVGDAKYLSLVRGKEYPPAKMMEICGHVWLLEKITAENKFLIFGNQKEVATLWLKKYGHLNKKIDFYFLNSKNRLLKLNNNL